MQVGLVAADELDGGDFGDVLAFLVGDTSVEVAGRPG